MPPTTQGLNNNVFRISPTGDLTGDLTINGEPPSRHGNTITEVFSMTDLPDPVGDVVTLTSGKYIFKRPITTALRFYIGAGQTVTITFADSRGQYLTYTGTNILFTIENASSVTFTDFNFLLTGNNSTFLSSSAVSLLNMQIGQVAFTGTGSKIATIANTNILTQRFLIFTGYESGISFDHISTLLYDQVFMLGNLNGTTPLLDLCSNSGDYITVSNCNITTGPSESFLDICPIITTPINIIASPDRGTGEFFKSGTTGAITAFADASTGSTAMTVTNASGIAQFNDIAHGLNVGETVTHTGCSNSVYNGEFAVTAATSDTYQVGVAYVGNDSGNYSTTTCLVTSASHGLANDTDIYIFDTVNFGGGYTVFNAQTNTFEISLGKAFPGTETGTWDTSSLDTRNPYVNSRDNGFQRDSKPTGSIVVGGNTATTTITGAGSPSDLNLGGLAVVAGSNEHWTVINSTTGEMRYDGITPLGVTVSGFILAETTAAAAKNYSFSFLRKPAGGVYAALPAPDNVDIDVEIKTTAEQTTLDWAFVVNPADTVKIQVTNNTDGSDIDILTLKKEIK